MSKRGADEAGLEPPQADGGIGRITHADAAAQRAGDAAADKGGTAAREDVGRGRRRDCDFPHPRLSLDREGGAGSSRRSVRESEAKELSARYDDESGHYRIKLGDALGFDSRYKMLDHLGEGTFGKVVETFDRRRRTHHAVKIIKAIPKYRYAAEIEIRVLNRISDADPEEKRHCVMLRGSFDFRNHVCMIFDMLGKSLYDHMKQTGFRPFHPKEVMHFSRQLLEAVDFIHGCKLTHTDLKPENILLVHPTPEGEAAAPLRRTDIQVIDFGSATFDDEHHTTVVSTRHYRAPEVILEVGWDRNCDIWSIGCIMMELATGEALFQTHDNCEHLAMMERIIGRIPEQLARDYDSKRRDDVSRGRDRTNRRVYFGSDHRLRWPELAKGRASVTYVRDECKRIEECAGADGKLPPPFPHLVRELLEFVPGRRLGAGRALEHPYFNDWSAERHSRWIEARYTSTDV